MIVDPSQGRTTIDSVQVCDMDEESSSVQTVESLASFFYLPYINYVSSEVFKVCVYPEH